MLNIIKSDQTKELKDPLVQKLWQKGFQFYISFFVSAETASIGRNTGIKNNFGNLMTPLLPVAKPSRSWRGDSFPLSAQKEWHRVP